MLVVFDIDGTLVDTAAWEDELYSNAVQQTLGTSTIDHDWTRFGTATDNGIMQRIAEDSLGRPLQEKELLDCREVYYANWRKKLVDLKDRLPPIPGAPDFFRSLQKSEDIRVAIATGGWETSAKMKLAAVGLDPETIPLASANDNPYREDVIETAIARAGGRHENTWYIGDGIWDVQAATIAKLNFLGIGTGDKAEKLKSHGATRVIENYLDAGDVLRHLRQG